jgi:phosphoglycolate phosphatase-like HAD superfamily hydrolase
LIKEINIRLIYLNRQNGDCWQVTDFPLDNIIKIMMNQNKLLLFDIDGTLIRGSYGHARSYSLAIKEIYGIEITVDWKSNQGLTDSHIIKKILKQKGLKEKEIQPKLQSCMAKMEVLYKTIVRDYTIIPLAGVKNLLKKLRNDHVHLGLVTGNLEGIAKLKLKNAGIFDYFKFGGYGSEHENRSILIELALSKAKKNLYLTFNQTNVFYIGDTPKDILAGKTAGIKTIGVATGIYPSAQLHNAGADLILEDLSNPAALIDFISSNLY